MSYIACVHRVHQTPAVSLLLKPRLQLGIGYKEPRYIRFPVVLKRYPLPAPC